MLYIRTSEGEYKCYYTDGTNRFISKCSGERMKGFVFGRCQEVTKVFIERLKEVHEEIGGKEFWDATKTIETELSDFIKDNDIHPEYIPDGAVGFVNEQTSAKYYEVEEEQPPF